MQTPDWFVCLLLALAVYRLWRLIAEDTILDKPRRWVVRLDPNWREEGDKVGDRYRYTIADFLTCPWCLGFWLVLIVWGCWQIWPHAVTVAAVPFALSAAVGITRGKLDPPD